MNCLFVEMEGLGELPSTFAVNGRRRGDALEENGHPFAYRDASELVEKRSTVRLVPHFS